MNPYQDIIHLPHHVSGNHPPMPMQNRAAQFAPFAALTGYDDAVEETARLTDQKEMLDEAELIQLDRKLNWLSCHSAEKMQVKIRYFVPDERKSGGCIKEISGVVQKFSMQKKWIAMEDGTLIPADQITAIEGDFPEY